MQTIISRIEEQEDMEALRDIEAMIQDCKKSLCGLKKYDEVKDTLLERLQSLEGIKSAYERLKMHTSIMRAIEEKLMALEAYSAVFK